MRFCRFILAGSFCGFFVLTTSAFVVNLPSATTDSNISSSSRYLSDQAARDLLYADQQKALEIRSKIEEELLRDNTSILIAHDTKNKHTKKKHANSGLGFGGPVGPGGKTSTRQRNCKVQADILRRDGVIRMDAVLSDTTADHLLQYVLEQQGWAATHADATNARSFYGVEQARTARCDLQLSLLRGGYARDDGSAADTDSSHVLADALQELLGAQGTLRGMYEELVSMQGEFYELAAVVTNRGSARQVIHPDLPFQDKPPLYVVFLALQDISEDMGPTSYLIGTHQKKENAQFMDQSRKDDLIRSADCRLSLLNKGDAVVFDARILHCGNANLGNTRALFNFSFRNPQVVGDLGYQGSIRPGYCQQMTLQDVTDALVGYESGNADPFAKYGTGLL